MKKVFQLAALFLCITIIASCFTGAAVLAAGTNSDSSSEFVIENGVFTRYNGQDGKVVIPEGVTKIGSDAFSYNSNITDVVLSNTVSEIDMFAFLNCNSLKSISVASNNKNFSSENGVLFNKDKSILLKYPPASKQKSYQIPQGVTDFESKSGAFSNCNNLCSIQIPDTVASLCSFAGCDHLAAINVSNTNINYCSQNGVLFSKDRSELLSCPPAYSNKTYVIPNSVIQIANNAFSNCNKLTDITIPNSVKLIEYSAFEYCGQLSSITIPDSVTDIWDCAFRDCTNLVSINLSQHVTDIEEYTFENCKSLKSINIPASVKEINLGAFSTCKNLANISVDKANRKYYSENGILFNKKKSQLLLWPMAFAKKSYVIPDSVTVINDKAFKSCSNLTDINIPNSVTKIGDEAFELCGNLTDINIPNSVTKIGDEAFESCGSLTDIHIPNSVTKIGKYAFSQCSQLSQISLPSGLSDIGGCAFDGTPWLDKFTGDTVIVNNLLIKYKGDSSKVIIPNGVLKIESDAFSSSNVTDVTIPNSTTVIGSNAFSKCQKLYTIHIPDSVNLIGGGAFFGCDSLKELSIPKSVSEIGENAIEENTVIVSNEGSAAQAYAQKNGNKFQLVSSPTTATSSLASTPQSTPAVTAAIKDLNSPASLPPVSLAVIIICAAAIGICIFLSIKKRNCQRRQSAQPEKVVSGTIDKYSTAESKPVDYVIPQPDKVICGQCGRSCPTEALFCPNCGHEMKTS